MRLNVVEPILGSFYLHVITYSIHSMPCLAGNRDGTRIGQDQGWGRNLVDVAPISLIQCSTAGYG